MDTGRPGLVSPHDSYDSTVSGPNGLSIDPSGYRSDDHYLSEKRSTASYSTIHPQANSTEQRTIYPAVAAYDVLKPKQDHIIHLSRVEQCMPRTYIRVCLAYRTPGDTDISLVMQRLNGFTRKLVDSKPCLSGYVVPVPHKGGRVGLVEVRFTDADFLQYPEVQLRRLSHDEVPYTYDELNKLGMPPSILRPDLLSELPEGTDGDYAPVFRMQANAVTGGIIVSVYLHHCLSDGMGLGFLITGRMLEDDFAFDGHLDARSKATPNLSTRLEMFADKESAIRKTLSNSDPNQSKERDLFWRSLSKSSDVKTKAPAPGRGCVLAFSKAKLEGLHNVLTSQVQNSFISSMDPLHALLWVHMSMARKPSLKDLSIESSKLLIPVNLRGDKKFNEPLSRFYFGVAVDFAVARLPLSTFFAYGPQDPIALSRAAVAIRTAIELVDESYTRQLIALVGMPDPDIDVRDLMASNMDRRDGADMYITSWWKLGLYNATLELGLGRPDWARKPWSKDPGSCVVMPHDDREDCIEVLVQMTEPDMERLLRDEMFMSYVERTID